MVCENPCKMLESPSTGISLHHSRIYQISSLISLIGAQIITYGNTFCSKYNKAEAMELFMMREEAKHRKTVVFVGMTLTISFSF